MPNLNFSPNIVSALGSEGGVPVEARCPEVVALTFGLGLAGAFLVAKSDSECGSSPTPTPPILRLRVPA